MLETSCSVFAWPLCDRQFIVSSWSKLPCFYYSTNLRLGRPIILLPTWCISETPIDTTRQDEPDWHFGGSSPHLQSAVNRVIRATPRAEPSSIRTCTAVDSFPSASRVLLHHVQHHRHSICLWNRLSCLECGSLLVRQTRSGDFLYRPRRPWAAVAAVVRLILFFAIDVMSRVLWH